MPTIVYDFNMLKEGSRIWSSTSNTAVYETDRFSWVAVYTAATDLSLSGMDALSTLDDAHTYDTANRLIYWSDFNGSSPLSSNVSTSNKIQRITTNYIAAENTGVAAKFVIGTANTAAGADPNGNSAAITMMMSGTISTIAANTGDLVLPTTLIVAGEDYKIDAQYYPYPDEFTY